MSQHALYGVNLAGWLTLEPWVTPSLFAQSGTTDAIALANKLGNKSYLQLAEHHRSTFITEADFAQIASRGYNAVRLEVPWYVFGPKGPLPGFHHGCLEYVDAAFEWAQAAGLSILIDISLAPGAKMSEDGLTQHLDFTPARRSALLDVVAGLASRYAGRDEFLGIEPIDEPQVQVRRGLSLTEGIPLHSLRNLYRDAYDVVRDVAGSKPYVVLSDGGQPGAWRRFMASNRYERVWLDHHLCRVGASDVPVGPGVAKRTGSLCAKQLAQAATSGLPVMVGEWCAELPGSTSGMTAEGKIALERVFIAAQINAMKTCPAWFFHTWKTEAPLASWDARIALSSFERDMLRLWSIRAKGC